MSLRTACPTLCRIPARLASIAPSVARLVRRLSPFHWWTWRLTRRLLFSLAVFATLLAILYPVENWRGRRALAAITREAAAQGLSLTITDHAPPPVPDGLNLAKTPLFQSPADPELRTRFWDDLQKSLEPHSYENPAVFENYRVDPAVIRADFQKSAATRHTDPLDVYLKRVTPLFAELSEACAARPHLRYDQDWNHYFEISLPRFGVFRGISRSSTTLALLDLENDRPADAARALSVPLRLRSALQSDPRQIPVLIGRVMGSLATSTIWQGQLRHQWTASELALFSGLLADDNTLPSIRAAFATEAAANVALCLRVADPSDPVHRGNTTAPGSERMLLRFYRFAPSGWCHQNAVAVVRHSLDYTLRTVDVSAARVHPDRTAATQTDFMPGPLPYRALARMSTPDWQRTVQSIGQAKTANDLARLAIALEQYRLAQGAYPESLAPVLAASPALSTLHDPFTGEPYRYRRDADGGFTLWGAGQNTRDDGAAYPAPSGPGPHRFNYDTGDLVWRVPGS